MVVFNSRPKAKSKWPKLVGKMSKNETNKTRQINKY